MQSFEIKWEAPEYEYREKDVSWYWISMIIVAGIIAFSVWEKNFLFGFFMVIAEILLIVYGNKEPRTVGFTLNERSFEIDYGKIYRLNEFGSWSVDESDGGQWAEIALIYKAKFKLPVKFRAPQARLEEFRNSLKTVLREVEPQHSFVDTLEKFFWF